MAVGVRGLPVLLHPTELQLAHIAADGTLSVHLYDHVETLCPGKTPTWAIEYWYLDLGQRQHRHLRLSIRGYRVVPRGQVRVLPGPAPWTPGALAEILGLGLPFARPREDVDSEPGPGPRGATRSAWRSCAG